jgi:hypothetical protein
MNSLERWNSARSACFARLSLAEFNTGLCVITTRTPVVDIADHERTSTRRRELEQLSNDAGAKLLQALGVKGHEAELRKASDEFRGHCLALTLLGSYLAGAYDGEIRYRNEVSARLAHDERQGAHARKVMESYQSWLREGPELAVLRMLGLFDRPADEKAFGRAPTRHLSILAGQLAVFLAVRAEIRRNIPKDDSFYTKEQFQVAPKFAIMGVGNGIKKLAQAEN